LPEREVPSHPPSLSAAAGGKKENWKALGDRYPWLADLTEVRYY
jgi:hypothetical protein